ncbi:MAG: 2-phospho-L-lactate guanylyltransferase [Roseomonas sp.]|nr:2-phospho-L-lactate guanylyltransferase [Roseomonas sp.]MCA3326287.1 2-phospho-L-lactate guanylyltransferase [Roseomonas sp.]MCA3329422.1 2-phospho-L-lactate guanylyltransferase [Roseomonas sp.]MCA3335829.1 2-phospho-L-lactate guanylyltransferase [Roseomonas sp.]MCA3348515.1 2-phospho-L-lactate guanylyltransferase [Roseomonas sp.]
MKPWVILPVKEMVGAKQRLAPLLSPEERMALMQMMLRDVLAALSAAQGLAGIAVVTLDPWAQALAGAHGARIITEAARAGHTGAVTAAASMLQAEGVAAILTLPGDIPAAQTLEIEALIATASTSPAFIIAPAHDEQGSNAILMAPPDAVKLRFGEDSYFPHLAAARGAGMAPQILRLPGIAMDIDHPADIARFARIPEAEGTQTLAWLNQNGILNRFA